jgi:hypothetical protein
MTQQTAVEWLYNDLFPKKLDGFSDEEWSKIIEAFEQAKEMDKQEKKYFFDCGRQYQLTGEGTFTQVYNETYKKD